MKNRMKRKGEHGMDRWAYIGVTFKGTLKFMHDLRYKAGLVALPTELQILYSKPANPQHADAIFMLRV